MAYNIQSGLSSISNGMMPTNAATVSDLTTTARWMFDGVFRGVALDISAVSWYVAGGTILPFYGLSQRISHHINLYNRVCEIVTNRRCAAQTKKRFGCAQLSPAQRRQVEELNDELQANRKVKKTLRHYSIILVNLPTCALLLFKETIKVSSCFLIGYWGALALSFVIDSCVSKYLSDQIQDCLDETKMLGECFEARNRLQGVGVIKELEFEVNNHSPFLFTLRPRAGTG